MGHQKIFFLKKVPKFAKIEIENFIIFTSLISEKKFGGYFLKKNLFGSVGEEASRGSQLGSDWASAQSVSIELFL